MKNILSVFIAALLLSGLLTSCKKNTYADDLAAEKALIEDFVKRNNIKVIDKMPDDSISFGANEYLKTSSGLYYRLEKPGTSDYVVETGDLVGIKYKEYTLTAKADTANYWDVQQSPYLREFVFGSAPSAGLQEAVAYMKRSGAEAKIIIPYKIGLYTSGNDVIPYGYDIKIIFRKDEIPGE